MSSDQGQGPKKGKKKRRSRQNRGQGQQQQQQSEQSFPRGIQEGSAEDSHGATALPIDEKKQETSGERPQERTTQEKTTPQTISTPKQDGGQKHPESTQGEPPSSSTLQHAQPTEVKPQPLYKSHDSPSKDFTEPGTSKTSKRNRSRKKKAGPTPELTPEQQLSTTSTTGPEVATPLKIAGKPEHSEGKHGPKVKATTLPSEGEPFPPLGAQSQPSNTLQQPPQAGVSAHTTTAQTPTKPLHQPSKQKGGSKQKGKPTLSGSEFPTLTTPTQPPTAIAQPQMVPPSKPVSPPTTIAQPPTKSPPTTIAQPPRLIQQPATAPLKAPHQPPAGTPKEQTPPSPSALTTGTKPKTPIQLPVTHSPLQSSKAELRPPRRPDKGGTSGRKIRLRVNFFPIDLPKDDIHHYDTEIKAKGQKSGDGYTKSEAPRIIQLMVEKYEKECPSGPKLVYDRNGKNLYCRKPIPGIGRDTREFKVTFTTDNGKEREYTVRVKWVSQVSLYNLEQALKGKYTEIPQDTMQAVEVVLRHLPSTTKIPFRSSFFNYPDGNEKDLGYGLQVWNGTFMSFRPSQWKMVLNVDTCSTAFYKAQSLLDFICEFFGFTRLPSKLNDEQCRKFGKEMKGIKIETLHIKRKQRVNGHCKSARGKEFECEGKKTTVFEYFKKAYGLTLRYPDLPCVKVGQSSYIPVELCNITLGQRKEGKLTADQTREMIRHTALPAPERQKKINSLVGEARFAEDPYHKDFGIKVGKEMMAVTGRVLDPPAIAYGRQAKEIPKNGVWNMQHISYSPIELREWAIISFEDQRYLNEGAVDFFITKLVEGGRDKGLRIHPSPCNRRTARGCQQINQIFGQLQRDYPNLQLIIVIFPGKGNLDEYYEGVKHFGDVIYGINTQCIMANTAKRKAGDKQTMANICLKINAKLGGTTFVLDKAIRSHILKRPVIIFGADVTHPSPGDKTAPSIAAVVASMDSHPNLYSAESRVQEHRREIIVDLKEMVKVLLKKFRAKTRNTIPEKIIFYRDGVSEGQFKEVLIHELQAIQHACLDLNQNYKPAITFVVVQKRHHARFFAESPSDQCGKSKNIPAGTIVDQTVCHPFEFDWYLCSHAGIQGTSKPAHYHVLYDDSNFKSDDLQILTNQLCHTYVRCARAVSIPAPAYYAHHVAFRARYHLNEVERGSSEGSVASGETTGLPTEEMVGAITVHENMKGSMYFA